MVSRHFNSTRELWGFSSVLAISSLTSCLVWFNIGINNCVLSNSIKSALNLNQRNGTQLYWAHYRLIVQCCSHHCAWLHSFPLWFLRGCERSCVHPVGRGSPSRVGVLPYKMNSSRARGGICPCSGCSRRSAMLKNGDFIQRLSLSILVFTLFFLNFVFLGVSRGESLSLYRVWCCLVAFFTYKHTHTHEYRILYYKT